MNPTDNGIVSIRAHRSVDDMVTNLEETFRAKQIKLFAIIDHSGEAQAADLEMRPTKLLIFGNPKAGTPLMLAAPEAALDLPLKLLVWEDAEGHSWISYNAPSWLQTRYLLPTGLLQNIAVIEQLAAKAAESTIC
jgi:uncharacterized protein (DUF302 family)